MRTLIDLPEDDIGWLDRKASEEGKSRAALVREAIAVYRAETSQDGIDRYFGLWKRHGRSGDGLDHQRRFRGEWVRDWDPDQA